jgi:hypothetical protein
MIRTLPWNYIESIYGATLWKTDNGHLNTVSQKLNRTYSTALRLDFSSETAKTRLTVETQASS